MIAHCLFEQSGTFKNEFKKLGIEAYDYDILNEYGETDYQIDLFKEIENAYRGGQSIFDSILPEDLILAFFPCTRFECKVPLWFRGEATQQKSWSDEKKLSCAMDMHEELHRNYELICKLTLIVMRRGLRMMIENPFNQPHYLTQFWCIKPRIIDKNRRLNGDYMEKPTQYWFIGFEPYENLVWEAIDWVPVRNHDRMTCRDGKSRQTLRSEIHPQYANRFIRQYLIESEGNC